MYPKGYRTGDEDDFDVGPPGRDFNPGEYRDPTPEEIAAEDAKVVNCLVCDQPARFGDIRDAGMCPKCNRQNPETSWHKILW